MSDRYVCIHGHFYQPPRENPWLEAVEPQDSAAPYHDWNARVLAECYAPNTASRILDDEDRIVAIVNNYARISFDFGPTLLSWMEREAPECYGAILDADAESRRLFSGHGSAIAQVYNHAIMPLATDRDQEIQVVWGLRDFEHRFGREAEGMWLAETAVDTRTLEALARHGVRFTVLSPYQARAARRSGSDHWEDVSNGRVDTTRAYLKRLPSGRSIALFFYDGTGSKAVAFEGLLHRGEDFARRLLSLKAGGVGPTLTHIATDGESYGHHHPHGDMALAFALDVIDRDESAHLTNYGEFLERFPPELEVEIVENSSWSCAHGVERWRSDCGCRTGGPPGWSQSWRAPLRAALDELRDGVLEPGRRALAEILPDPEAAVHGYIDCIIDRSADTVEAFLSARGLGDGPPETQVRALKLLELERQLQLMYTSCGWFFNDLAGIETVQILRYAGRAVQLAEDVLGLSFEPALLESLAKARSNRPLMGSGQDIYLSQVSPSKMTWESLAAHYGISSLLQNEPDHVYCYELARESLERFELGRSRLLLGRARLTSTITRASERLEVAVLHLDDRDVTAGVARLGPDAAPGDRSDLTESFLKGDTKALSKSFEKRYPGPTFDLHSLFGDEQRRILELLLRATLEEAESAHRHIYEHHWGTVRLLADLDVPLPKSLSVAAEVVLNAKLRRALESRPSDPALVGSLVREAVTEGVKLDEAGLAFVARESLEALADAFFGPPAPEPERLAALRDQVRLVSALPFEVDLWRVQNVYFQHGRRGSAAAELHGFVALGEELAIKVS